MSHRGVEIVLGRLTTDTSVRRRFVQDPALALRELIAQGIELSPVELAVLEKLDPLAVEHLALALDSRLKRAALESPSDAPGLKGSWSRQAPNRVVTPTLAAQARGERGIS